MPAPTRKQMNQGVLNALRAHLEGSERIREFDFQGPEYTSTFSKYPVEGDEGRMRDWLVEAWFFSVRKKKSRKGKAVHKAKVVSGAASRGTLAAADTTMSPFPPGFAPTSGMSSELVGDVYAVRPGTNISTHLYHDRTWTGALTKIFTTLEKLGETETEKANRRGARADLKRMVHRAKWPAYMVRIYTRLKGNPGTRPMRGYYRRLLEIGRVAPDTRSEILTRGWPQMTLRMTPYHWVVRRAGEVPGRLSRVGKATPSVDNLADLGSGSVQQPERPRPRRPRHRYWKICEPQIQ